MADAGANESLRAQAFEQLQQGLFEDAVESFTATLAFDPQDAKALQGRAIAQFQLKHWPEAQRDFEAAKAIDPDDPENWVGFGITLAVQTQIYPAIDVFEGLLAQKPQYVRGRIQLALLYFQLSLIAKGREQMQQALNQRPTLAERRFIESTLADQAKQDKKRYYRPDFEALRRQKQDDK